MTLEQDQQAQLLELYAPEKIIALVQKKELLTQDLRQRFDSDYDLFQLKEFKGITTSSDQFSAENEEQFLHYTSSDPQNYANKLMQWVSDSKTIIRIDNTDTEEFQARLNTLKQQFALGLLHAVDDRLEKLMEPTLKEQLSFHACIRGYVFGRAILRNTPTGIPVVDVTPWDPLNVFWEIGSDGLVWACHKTKKSQGQIAQEYGVQVEVDTGTSEPDDGFTVYDYYDGLFNTVVMDNRDAPLKSPTPHFSPRIPIFYGAAGRVPRITRHDGESTLVDYGDSIFSASRDTNEKNNFMMSVLLHLAAQTRERSHKVFSADGNKTTEGDINVPGQEFGLVAGQEDIEAMLPAEATRDLSNMLAMISGETQRGTLSHIHFGDSPFSLSGFAMNTLRLGAEDKLNPRLRLVESALRQIINLLSDQFATGMWPSLQLTGADQNKHYFNIQPDPRFIAAGGDYQIELIAQLPEDDATKVQMAQLAREAPFGVPLMPDRKILQDIMEFQDVEDIQDELRAQVAERATPMATMYMNMQAAINQGNQGLAMIYFRELQMILIMQKLQTFGLAPDGLPGPQGPELGSPSMLSSSVSPAASLGRNAAVTPQASENPSNNGRQQSPDGGIGARLNALGLSGPQGG